MATLLELEPAMPIPGRAATLIARLATRALLLIVTNASFYTHTHTHTQSSFWFYQNPTVVFIDVKELIMLIVILIQAMYDTVLVLPTVECKV